MKKLSLIISFAVLFSCNSGAGNETVNNQADNQPELTALDHTAQPANDPETRLTNGIPELNNGEKWQADASTNANVESLKSIVTEFKQNAQPGEEDYKVFQEKFTAALNKMVQECRMKGADHDALHVWLEPLMQDNQALKNAGNKNEMERLVNQISDRLHIYNKYFA